MKGGPPGARNETSVLPIVVHGDASFAGEGVVPETLNMSRLRGYRVGGTLHIIGNNQVGFTTDPIDARSTHYASDLAKGFEMPIVHVNGDDAESCLHAVRLGIAYRQRFDKDFFIDLVGYRRHGHNEADQPAFTQPLMYKVIGEHPTPRAVFGARLVRERVMTDDEVAAADKALVRQAPADLPGAEAGARAPEHEPPRKQSASARPPVEPRCGPSGSSSLNEQLLGVAVDVQAASDDAAHAAQASRRNRHRAASTGATPRRWRSRR